MPKIEFTDEEVSVLARFLTSFSTKNLDMKIFEGAREKIRSARIDT